MLEKEWEDMKRFPMLDVASSFLESCECSFHSLCGDCMNEWRQEERKFRQWGHTSPECWLGATQSSTWPTFRLTEPYNKPGRLDSQPIFFFGHTTWLGGSSFPNWGLNLGAQWWTCKILTTRPPRNFSPFFLPPSPSQRCENSLKWLKGRLTGKKQSVKEEGAYGEAFMEEAISQGPIGKTQRLDLNPYLPDSEHKHLHAVRPYAP